MAFRRPGLTGRLAWHGKTFVEATVTPTEKPPACLETAVVCKQPKTTSRAAVARGARVSERKLRKAKAVRQASPALAEKVRGRASLTA